MGLFVSYLVISVTCQECAGHKEKSKQCGASGSVADYCCEGHICNFNKKFCRRGKCAAVNKRSKECGSPKGASKCCDGLVCHLKRCVEPKQPTISPTISPSSALSQIQTANPSISFPSEPTRPNQACRNEKKNLGKSFTNVEQCIAAAKVDPTCSGSEVMWSDSYNKWWGCRCCSEHATCPAESSEYYDNSNWDVYTYRECRTLPNYVKPNKECRYKSKNLGTSFKSAMECMEAAKADPNCSGNEIIWSDGYNYAWGCRCCSSHPTCPADASRYKVNNNWDLYEYARC